MKSDDAYCPSDGDHWGLTGVVAVHWLRSPVSGEVLVVGTGTLPTVSAQLSGPTDLHTGNW